MGKEALLMLFLKMRFSSERTVSDIVRADYRTADVFKKHGINFCCSGKVSLADACAVNNINYNTLLADLEIATFTISLPNGVRFHQWKLDFLIDYIVNIHHAYLWQTIPSLETRLLTFVDTHGRKQPELEELLNLFQEFTQLMQVHLRHEEEIIFPYIKQIASAHHRKEPYGNLFVRTLRKPLTNIEKEDAIINSLLKQMAAHTDNFTFPVNACTNHQVVFHKLRELHDDVMQHQYLENVVLFPRAMEIERQLLAE
jgi:regulator of cell morphogenesis and NO signaling